MEESGHHLARGVLYMWQGWRTPFLLLSEGVLWSRSLCSWWDWPEGPLCVQMPLFSCKENRPYDS